MKICDASNENFLGYVSRTLNSFGEYGTTINSGEELKIKVDISVAGPVNLVTIVSTVDFLFLRLLASVCCRTVQMLICLNWWVSPVLQTMPMDCIQVNTSMHVEQGYLSFNLTFWGVIQLCLSWCWKLDCRGLYSPFRGQLIQ